MQSAVDPVNLFQRAAFEGIEWICDAVVDTPDGTLWPKNPYRGADISWGLYHGVPGVLLALLGAYRETEDTRYLKLVELAADAVERHVPAECAAGLYIGLAGQAVALHQVYLDTGDERCWSAARGAIKRVLDEARAAGEGIEWNDSTDIISGSAGIGLALLELACPLDLPEALEIAMQAGKRLCSLAHPEQETEGQSWLMKPSDSEVMPNFAHGTAGVAYFLARLGNTMGCARFLDAARLGACHLLGLAAADAKFRIYLSAPSHADSFALGWCHGPAGTGRLFYLLGQATGETEWYQHWLRLNEWIFQSGLPEVRPENLGNRISRCCGDAILCEYLLDLHLRMKDSRALPLATALAEKMLERGRNRADGSRWWEQPGWSSLPILQPGTGLMQGIAGVVMSLFRLHRAIQGQTEHALRLPDDPFA